MTNPLFFIVSFIFILTFPSSFQSYPFCPKCVYYYHYTTSSSSSTTITPTKPNCSLFKNHPLFKDRPDVDFIGKEICTTDGKYFKPKPKEGEDGEFIVAS